MVQADVNEALMKTVPAVAGVAWSFWGFSLQEWAAIATIVYTLFMTFFLLKDRYKRWKKERNK